MVLFSKKVDGTYYVVEAVSDAKRKRNYIVSAYLKKETPAQQPPNAEAFGITSKHEIAGASVIESDQRPLDVQAPNTRPKTAIAGTDSSFIYPAEAEMSTLKIGEMWHLWKKPRL